MMEKTNQQFALFQTVMLQTMKDLIINMVKQIINQQRSTLLFPSPQDMFSTQPRATLMMDHYWHIHILRNSHWTRYHNPSYILPLHLFIYNLNPLKAPPHQQPKRFHHHFHQIKTQTILPLPQSQTSFENTMTAIDADLWVRHTTYSRSK